MALPELINTIPLFKHFTEEEKNLFQQMDHSMQGFSKDDVIIKEGDLSTSLYLLVSGIVRITKTGFTHALAELKPGAIIGEMSFFTQKPRYSNVIAAERVMVLKMDKNFFKKVSPEIRDKIKNHIIEILIGRLDTMNESLVKIARFARGSMQP